MDRKRPAPDCNHLVRTKACCDRRALLGLFAQWPDDIILELLCFIPPPDLAEQLEHNTQLGLFCKTHSDAMGRWTLENLGHNMDSLIRTLVRSDDLFYLIPRMIAAIPERNDGIQADFSALHTLGWLKRRACGWDLRISDVIPTMPALHYNGQLFAMAIIVQGSRGLHESQIPVRRTTSWLQQRGGHPFPRAEPEETTHAWLVMRMHPGFELCFFHKPLIDALTGDDLALVRFILATANFTGLQPVLPYGLTMDEQQALSSTSPIAYWDFVDIARVRRRYDIMHCLLADDRVPLRNRGANTLGHAIECGDLAGIDILLSYPRVSLASHRYNALLLLKICPTHELLQILPRLLTRADISEPLRKAGILAEAAATGSSEIVSLILAHKNACPDLNSAVREAIKAGELDIAWLIATDGRCSWWAAYRAARVHNAYRLQTWLCARKR